MASGIRHVHGNALSPRSPSIGVANERPATIEPDPEPMSTRRRFLRDAAILTGVGVASGCLEQVDGPGPGDATGGGQTDLAPDGDDHVDEQVKAYERAIHQRVNLVRKDHGLDPLEYNEAIAAVAREHSQDMAERDYFAHVSPEGDGPDDRLDDFFPGHCQGIGENIASVGRFPGDDTDAVAERVVSGWMESPPHRENLLREAFDEEGIGVAISEDDQVLATQNFCATAGFA